MKWSLFALCIGFCIDLLIGDPHGLPHPVAAIGHLISLLERLFRRLFPKTPGGERAAGACIWILTALIAAALPALLLWGCARVSVWLRLAVESLIGKKPLIVAPGMKTGMNVRIDDPSTMAGDLVVGSVAAIACYGAPLIVIDMGTATTMVLIDNEGSYRGGAIIPGIKLSYGALSSGTSLLPDIAILPPKKVIATNTVDSMRSGAVYGTAAMLDGMIDRMEKEIGYPCTVVATGGLARTVVKNCSRDIIYDADLLLKGLWVLYDRNRKS